MGSVLSRAAALLASLLLLVGAYEGVARPWHRAWGTTPEERGRPLPGDELVPGAPGVETHAVTVRAPAPVVFAWLAQVGQDRAGFYSFERLEDLVGCEMPSGDRLDPSLQRWKPGDKLWMYPEEKAGGVGYATLRVYQPGRALVFGTRQLGTPPPVEDGSWAWVVEPLGPSQARLLMRGRAAAPAGLGAWLVNRYAFEPIHFAMERRMMLGLKDRAEGSVPARFGDDLQVALWTAVFALWVASAVVALRGKRTALGLSCFLFGGVTFQLLTLVQPSPLLGAPLLFMLAAMLAWPHNEINQPLCAPPPSASATSAR